MPVQTRAQTRTQHTETKKTVPNAPLDGDSVNDNIFKLLPQGYSKGREFATYMAQHTFLKKMPHQIQSLYHCVNDVNSTVILTSPRWVLMSLKEVINRYNTKQNQNTQCTMIDFASMYDGMGYYIVCCYCVVKKALFYRMDGGSCAQEVEYNFKFASSSFVPDTSMCFDTSQWVCDVHTEKTPEQLKVVHAP